MRLRAMTEHLLRIAQFICSRFIVIGQESTSLHASDIDTSLAWQTAQLLLHGVCILFGKNCRKALRGS